MPASGRTTRTFLLDTNVVVAAIRLPHWGQSLCTMHTSARATGMIAKDRGVRAPPRGSIQNLLHCTQESLRSADPSLRRVAAHLRPLVVVLRLL